jgi:hypothetical protein
MFLFREAMLHYRSKKVGVVEGAVQFESVDCKSIPENPDMQRSPHLQSFLEGVERAQSRKIFKLAFGAILGFAPSSHST